MHRFAALLLVAACSSKSAKREPEPPPTAVETAPANDPWAPRPSTPGNGNINKIVIGGNNDKPQMGLFALTSTNAREVDRAMNDGGLEAAYRLAEKISVKAWAGDRNFCEDAVRQTIGFYGIDGMLDPSDLRKWKTAKLDELRTQHGKAINQLHFDMIGERDEAACDKTLAIYAEGLQLAATQKLELRNFGY